MAEVDLESQKMNPVDVTESYFAYIRARDLDGLIALYAADACFVLPNGRELSGIDAIRAMHRSVFAAGGPFPTPLRSIASASSIAVEIEAKLADGTVRRTANFYYLNEAARIQRLSVYMRGG
jgi:ketosteroid isomerase-like protein